MGNGVAGDGLEGFRGGGLAMEVAFCGPDGRYLKEGPTGSRVMTPCMSLELHCG